MKKMKTKEYPSMFDPFREQIEQWCDDGLSIKQAFNKLPEGYRYESFYEYIKKKHIKETQWKRAVATRNVCDECEHCKHFLNVMGRENKHHNRICLNYMRLLSNDVKYCPVWCEYKREEVEERSNGTENS